MLSVMSKSCFPSAAACRNMPIDDAVDATRNTRTDRSLTSSRPVGAVVGSLSKRSTAERP